MTASVSFQLYPRGLAEVFKLSTAADWSSQWSGTEPENLEIDPKAPEFFEFHQALREHLPVGPAMRFVEVGCFPGQYMKYFHDHFGHRISGIEYVDWCADRTRRRFANQRIDAEVICEDLFSFVPDPSNLWDVVGSFGFIEHFDDTDAVLRKHLELVRPNGYLVVMIPNHSGFRGRLLERISPSAHAIHNCMSYEDIAQSLARLGGTEVCWGGYFNSLGLGNLALVERAHELGPMWGIASRALRRSSGEVGRLLPNNRFVSACAGLIARKMSSSQRSD